MPHPTFNSLDIREDMPQFTREEAIAISEREEWKKLSDRDLVTLQFIQERLFVPFGVFHEKTEAVLGRPVFTHEFAFRDHLIDELMGRKKKATFNDVIDLLPAEKTAVVIIPDGDAAA